MTINELYEIINQIDIKMSRKGFKFYNKNYLKKNNNKEKIKFNKSNNIDKKLVTFIMPLKNRTNRALLSIKSIVNEENSKFFNFVIVEDISESTLKIPEEYSNNIDYHLVDTKKGWSRSKLLNYGIKRSKTDLCLMWDSDFIFPKYFKDKLIEFLSKVDYLNYYFAIPSHETHKTKIINSHYKPGDLYGNLWIYPTKKLFEVKGFNEKMENHGLEERELQKKLKEYLNLNVIYTYNLVKKLRVYHYSHGNNLRGKNGWIKNLNFLRNLNKNSEWGELKKIN